MKHTTMEYSLTGNESTSRDLERIISTTAALKKGKERVESLYEYVTVDVMLESGTNQRGHRAPIYSVEMRSKSDIILRLALNDFFAEAGFPFFVTGGYDDVDGVLRRYGKRLQRKPVGAAAGRHVVDAGDA